MTTNTKFIDSDSSLLIPSVELNGTREAKLMQLDTVLSQLNAIRRVLAGGAQRPQGPAPDRSGQGWWVAGIVLAVLFALSTLGAWVAANASDQTSLSPIGVVHETF